MQDSFEDQFKQLAKFFNAAAHELRTPVTTAKIYVQLLQQLGNGSADPMMSANLAKTEGQLNKLNLLISNILDVSRIYANKFSVAVETVVLNDCIRTAVSARKELQDKYKLSVNVDESVTVVGNKDRIVQVLSNILDNAVKFSKPQTDIHINVIRSADKAFITVSDQGKGLSAETIHNAFSGYGSDAVSHAKGLHIGLYVSKMIIEAMHGSIAIVSEENKGTTVNIELPLVNQA